MYNSPEIAERIKKRVKQQGKTMGDMLSSCGLGINTVSKMAKGTDILTQNFARIADYLDSTEIELICTCSLFTLKLFYLQIKQKLQRATLWRGVQLHQPSYWSRHVQYSAGGKYSHPLVLQVFVG